jgi:hypothetical protein
MARSIVPCDTCSKRCSAAQIALMSMAVLDALKKGQFMDCPDRVDYYWYWLVDAA